MTTRKTPRAARSAPLPTDTGKVRTKLNGVPVEGNFTAKNGEMTVFTSVGHISASLGGIPDDKLAVMLLREIYLLSTSRSASHTPKG